MIRMLAGSYGFRTADGLIRPKTPADGPFTILDTKDRTGAEREAQLVEQGIAEYVEAPAEAEPVKAEKPVEKPAPKPRRSRKKAAEESAPALKAADPE